MKSFPKLTISYIRVENIILILISEKTTINLQGTRTSRG